MKIKHNWIEEGKINKEEYSQMYEESINNNENFWEKKWYAF